MTQLFSTAIVSHANVLNQADDLAAYVKQHKELTLQLKLATPFAQTNSTRERIWYVIHNTISPPRCVECHTKGTNWNTRDKQFRQYCSSRCSNKSTTKMAKQRNTMMDRYGVAYPLQSSNIRQKSRTTLLTNYGVTSPTKSAIIQQRIITTNNTKYGVDRPAQSDVIKNKTKQTNLERYGVDWCPMNEDIKTKQQQSLMLHYGVVSPMHNVDIRKRQHATYTDNRLKHPAQYHIPQDVLDLLNDYQYLYTAHINDKRSCGDIGTDLHVHAETVRQHLIKHDIEVHRYFSSVGEGEVLHYMRGIYSGEILSNDRTLIYPYELDILIPEHSIAIEYCGLYWHSEQAGKDKHYHQRKYQMCKERGVQLITLYEDEWKKRQNQVERKLEVLISKRSDNRVYARKTTLVFDIDNKTKRSFLEKHHIQGVGAGSITLGLECEGELVAMLTISKQTNCHYLNRYATSCNVVGGLSKLVSAFERNYEWDELITFADLRWSCGGVYKHTGWVYDKTLSPDYYYSPNGVDRYHKSNYRLQQLPRKLDTFDPGVSERENCDNNGILRIWDCGKERYTKRNQIK